jgi:hypothetical protein
MQIIAIADDCQFPSNMPFIALCQIDHYGYQAEFAISAVPASPCEQGHGRGVG